MAVKNNNNNSRNPQSRLYRTLTRLFSGPIVSRRAQTERQLRRVHLDKYSTDFKSLSGRDFKRAGYNPFDILAVNAISNHNRSERYLDFQQMEYMPEIASALDIYADEMTTSSPITPMLDIHCPNEEIKIILKDLYHNILNVDFNLFGWFRTMCKYGDFFLYLDIDEKMGVQSAIGLPSNEVERLEGEDKTNPNYFQFQWNSGGMTFENWQVAHFRVLGNDKHAPYGTSVLEPARRIWRQLTLMEDAMMAYRIVRSPERRVFYIDVGNIPPQDVEQYMQKIVTQMKRNQIVDKDTGRVDLRYNPLSVEEDYFIPVRAGQSSRIDSLPGGTFTGDIDDVKYLQDKLFAAIKVPQSYLSRGEGADEDKTTLAQKDVRFARTIQRLQRSGLSELEKVGIIHLYVLGFRGDDLLSFDLSLGNPSKIAEMQELEHWKSKFDAAGSATEGFFSRRWVYKHMFNMSDEEILRNQREMYFDRKFTAKLDQAAEDVATEAEGLGGEEFGEEEFGEEELGEEEFGEEELGGEELGGEEEEGVLLAEPPGNRRDDETRVYAHGGKYRPVKNDQREKTYGRGRSTNKRMHAAGSREKARSGKRNLFAGDVTDQLTKGFAFAGLEEQTDGRDLIEERKLFITSQEVKSLIESLNTGVAKDETKAQ